jgi:hypothetical protein
MEDAIEQRGGQRAVMAEDLGSVLKRTIGPNDGRAMFTALADDLNQSVGTMFVDG